VVRPWGGSANSFSRPPMGFPIDKGQDNASDSAFQESLKKYLQKMSSPDEETPRHHKYL
jgi:hypothetical protein